MDHHRVLRATTRYNNWFSYDVETKCDKITNKTLFDDAKGPFNTNEVNNCKLTGGYSVSILEYTQELYNFKIDLVTNIWAHDFKNAYKYSIDLYAGRYILREVKERFVVPTVPIGTSAIVAVINHEHDVLLDQDLTLTPFQHDAWLLFISIIFLILFTVTVLCKVGQKLGLPSFCTRDAITEIMAYILTKTGEGQLSRTGTWSFRLLVLTTSSTFMILATLYSSSLVAKMSTLSYNIKSLKDLINSNYELLLTVGCVNCSSITFSIQKASEIDSLAQQLLSRKSDMSLYYNTFEKAIYGVRGVPLALFTYEDTIDDTIHKHIGEMPCTWSKIPVLNIRRYWGMLIRPNSSYRSEVNQAFLKVRETGIIKQQQKKWMPRMQACEEVSRQPIVSVHNMGWAYIVLALGGCLSFIIVLLEIKWKTRKSAPFIYN